MEPKTLDEIGRCFKLTRERIRQINASALKKLRHNAELQCAASEETPSAAGAKKRVGSAKMKEMKMATVLNSRLTALQRTAITRLFLGYEGSSFSEAQVAEQLNISVGTLRKVIAKAMTKLAKFNGNNCPTKDRATISHLLAAHNRRYPMRLSQETVTRTV